MASTSTRRPPHVFNLMRQLDVLERAGSVTAAESAWKSAASVSRAFDIGKAEGQALFHLRKNVPPPVVVALRDAVRIRGMRCFLSHDTVSKEVFNSAYSSGVGTLSAWDAPLTNKGNDDTALLLVRRMCSDWDKQPPTLRKPWGHRETVAMHAICGGYLHFMAALKSKVPKSEYEHVAKSIDVQFMSVFQLNSNFWLIPARSVSQEIENRNARELEEKNRELKETVAKATLEQLRLKVKADFEVLKEHLPSKQKEAKEAAQDVQYLRQRQQYVLVMLDATIFPANSKQLMCAFQILTTVLGMAGRNLGHVQLPIPQTNTTSGALVKHRRVIEDALLTNGCDITNTVAVVFEKPSDSTAADRRGGVQTCVAVCQDPKASPWSLPMSIGPLSLVKVSDMLGYDPDSRPGATARAEQMLRYAEFGRALVTKKLDGKWPKLSYVGLLRESQKDVILQLEEMVYNAWDNSGTAPAKTRPREEAQVPRLTALLWGTDGPSFPESILGKFAPGTEQHTEVLKWKKDLEDAWPRAATAAPTTGSARRAPARAAGSPDFTGTDVLDLAREVDLAKIKTDDFAEEKLAHCPGRGNKPSIIVAKDFKIYLANFASEEMAEGEESEIPYRYDISGVSTGKTNCYKANALAASFDHQSHKTWSLCAVFNGNMQFIPRQEVSKIASLVWEVLGLLFVWVHHWLHKHVAVFLCLACWHHSCRSGAVASWWLHAKDCSCQAQGVSHMLSSVATVPLGEAMKDDSAGDDSCKLKP
ncbi:unnamed protein product [Durusdinium trenchii]|uniref:Uncharacterized protein n=1 Tax=Durusdinium trenchii TaxID=1381693 RepID=A0ABP0JGK1_9DINO